MQVNVGAGNSLKVKAVRAVFAVVFPEDDIKVNAINMISGVPAQRVMSIRRLMSITPFLRFLLDIAVMDT